MTACVYANPGYPIIISDCLLSNLLPNGKIVETLRPDNLHLYASGPRPKMANLANKFVQLNESTLVTFAGDGNVIVPACRKLPNLYANRQKGKRPMEFVGDIAFEANMSPIPGKISVLGATPVETSSGPRINFVKPESAHELDTESDFGVLYGIGTGAKELAASIADYVKHVPTPDTDAKGEWFGFYWGLIGALNGEYLFNTTKEIKPRSWGGYLQINMFDAHTMQWKRVRSWAHLCIGLDIENGNIEPANRMFFYQGPTEQAIGNLFAYSQDPKTESWNKFVWGIEDPAGNLNIKQVDWSHFDPEGVTISIIAHKMYKLVGVLHRTLDSNERKRATILIRDNEAEINLDPNDMKRIISDAKKNLRNDDQN